MNGFLTRDLRKVGKNFSYLSAKNHSLICPIWLPERSDLKCILQKKWQGLVHSEFTKVSSEFASGILGGSCHCIIVAFIQELYSPNISLCSEHLDEQVAHRNVLVLQMKWRQREEVVGLGNLDLCPLLITCRLPESSLSRQGFFAPK